MIHGAGARCFNVLGRFTLPETNSSHPSIDGWNTSFLLGWLIFMGDVSFRVVSVLVVGSFFVLLFLSEEKVASMVFIFISYFLDTSSLVKL